MNITCSILFLCAFLLVVYLVEIHTRNNKMEKLFPDTLDPDQHRARRELAVPAWPLYIVLALVVYLFIRFCF